MCIGIVETRFKIADGQISFLDDNFSKYQWNFTKFGLCIDIVEICFGIANGQISSIFDSYLPTIHYILLSGQ